MQTPSPPPPPPALAAFAEGYDVEGPAAPVERGARHAVHPGGSLDLPQGPVYNGAMKTLKAHVENGRVVVDEPVDLPEGTPLDLIVAGGEEDDLSDEERAALDASIAESWAQYQRGEFKPVGDLVETLRKRK